MRTTDVSGAVLQGFGYQRDRVGNLTAIEDLAATPLPGAGEGIYLALEYFENEGVTRDWIRECSPKKIVDQARTRNTGNSLTFFDSLVWGCQNDKVDYETAMAASENPSEFNRALRGIT